VSDRRLAVLIGSGSYPNEPKLQDLRCPSRDVDGLAAALRERGSFETVTVVKDAPHYEALLEVNRTLKAAGKEDLVFIYYSGHGKLDLANRLYLCTPNTVVGMLEATAIPVQSIRDYADVAPCHRIALVLDCCFSGAVGDVFARSSVDDQLQLVSRGRGTYIMTASTAVQVALEKEQDEYSAFTKHVIEGLQTEAADVDEDGVVTMDELYQYVHDQLKREGFQEPMKWAINVRGELVIARTGKSPRAERRNRIRERLLALASEGILPDQVLSPALVLLAMERAALTGRDAPREQLLDHLDQGRLSVGDFVQQWLRLQWMESASPQRDAVGPPVEPEPRAADHPPVDSRRAPRPETAEARPTTTDAPRRSATGEPPSATEKRPPATEKRPSRRADTRAEETVAELSLSSLWPAVRNRPAMFWRTFGASLAGAMAGALLAGFVLETQGWVFRLGSEEFTIMAVLTTACAAGVGLAQRWVALRSAGVRWFGATTAGWVLGSVLAWPFTRVLPFVLWLIVICAGGAGAAALMQSAALRLPRNSRRSWLLLSLLPAAGTVPFAVAGGASGLPSHLVDFPIFVVGYLALTCAGLTAVSGGWETAPTERLHDAPARGARLPLRIARAAAYAALAAATVALVKTIFPPL
jgi:uncharacterized caspase-like protein